MSDTLARRILLGLLLTLLGGSLLIDLPALSSKQFWNDGATYYSMAWSLAKDFDLVYESRDLERVKAEYPSGPQGVFLKRASGGLRIDAGGGFPWIRRLAPTERRIYYAKAFAYPLVAAPFVGLFGTPGLLFTNALFLALALWLGYGELRRKASPFAALAFLLVLLAATITPLYVLWPQPEIFNLGLVTAALVAWRRERPALSAVLFGIATYSKPTNLLLALPLGASPFFDARLARITARFLEAARRGLVVLVAAAAMYGVNAAATGEANYQGGERKTFYGAFPSEARTTFGNSGIWMTTEHVGPVVTERADHARAIERGVIVRSAREMRDTFVRNLGYFWYGRFAGAALYFLPVVVVVAWFVTRGPRDVHGALAGAALVLSWMTYVWLIPDNWYGGGGTVGNRYFLNLVPLAFFLVPSGAVGATAALGALGALLVAPTFAHPFDSSLRPWRHALTAPFRVFPAELTMLNDLSICADPWRKKQPFDDPDGDSATRKPPNRAGFWVYFPDDGTYGREIVSGVAGFWMRGGRDAEILLRALEPIRSVRVSLIAGPVGDVVTARTGRSRASAVLQPSQRGVLELRPPEGLLFYDSLVYVLHLESRTGASPGPTDPRILGAFVQLTLDVDTRTQR